MQTIEVTKPRKMTRREMREVIGDKPIHRAEMRHMVDLYNQIQHFRMAGTNQVGAAERSGEPPGDFAKHIMKKLHGTEEEIARYLDEMVSQTAVGTWAKSIVGVGPVIAAGFLAHIDIRQAPTVGHIWRFAGLDPSQSWLGAVKARALVAELAGSGPLEELIPVVAGRVGCKTETLRKFATSDINDKPIKLTEESLSKAAAKRPWNAALKVLCWKLGESFVKTYNNPEGYYGQVYVSRKVTEEAMNNAGKFADQAASILKSKRLGKSTEAYKAYSQGKLPPAHIHARAKRYAVKLFLAHYHWVAYESEYGAPPPKPFVIEHLGHADLLTPPNWKKKE